MLKCDSCGTVADSYICKTVDGYDFLLCSKCEDASIDYIGTHELYVTTDLYRCGNFYKFFVRDE